MLGSPAPKKRKQFFIIRLPPEFLPVVGPLTRWCASTLGPVLLCSSWRALDSGLISRLGWGLFQLGMFGSCLIYWTWRNHQYGLHLEDVYLELNAFPDRELNPEPLDLEPTALTVIPPCFGNTGPCIKNVCFKKSWKMFFVGMTHFGFSRFEKGLTLSAESRAPNCSKNERAKHTNPLYSMGFLSPLFMTAISPVYNTIESVMLDRQTNNLMALTEWICKRLCKGN